jgi:O-antigen ligase
LTTTTIAISEQPWFRSWKPYAGAIITIILSQVLGGLLELSFSMSLIVATQIVLFLMLFSRPVWAMASLLVGQFTAHSLMFSLSTETQISIRFIWTILAIVLLIPILKIKGGINLGSRAKSIIIPAALFYILATVANIANLDTEYIFQYLRTGITALAIIFFMPAIVRNERDARLLTIVILITCTLSAIAAIMQHYQHLGLPVFTLSGNTDMIIRGRTPGLSESPVHLAYELAVVIMPIIALFLTKGVSLRARILLPILALIMLLGLYFSYTRSGIYSLVPAMLIMIFLLKGKLRKELLLIFLALAVTFLLYINITNNRYSKSFGEESSAAGRLILWQAGAMIALDHPIFGIGQGRFVEISELYSEEVTATTALVPEAVLGQEEAHNDFIRVWVSFGTLALLAYLFVFVSTFRNFFYGYKRSKHLFVKGLALGGFAALISYMVNAFTHNLMDSSPILWILAGFSLALVKLADSQTPVTAKVPATNNGSVNGLLPNKSKPEPKTG